MTKLNKIEIAKIKNDMALIDDDLASISKWYNVDRFDIGLKNLENLFKMAELAYRTKTEYGRTKFKGILNGILDTDVGNDINKPDFAAIVKIGALDSKTMSATKKRYVDECKFMVSPRSILKWIEDKPKAEKTDFEKICQTLKTLDSQAQNYELTELELAEVKKLKASIKFAAKEMDKAA